MSYPRQFGCPRIASGGVPSGDAASPAVRDPARLSSLRDTGVLDREPDEAFMRLNRLAVELLGVPVSLVSLVDESRQFFAGQVGVPEPWASFRETPLSHSFCQHVVNNDEPLVIEDARSHPLVSANLAVRDLGVAAYAGVPVRLNDGSLLGAFCAIDGTPRAWTQRDVSILCDLAGMAADLLELRRAEAGSVLRDPLTELPSRSLFVELVTRSLTRGVRNGSCVSVLAVGLDGFRLINEALGHAGGDQVLRTVGQRLASTLRGSDSVCRMAGDEFLVLCESLRDEAEAMVVAQRLRDTVITDPVRIDGRDQLIAATVGVACSITPVDAGELIDAALAGLRRAKAGARKVSAPVDPARRARADSRLRLRSEIAGAHTRGEMRLVYQPVMEITGRQMSGVEALLRWEHPDLGLIPPDDFIPDAEKSGAIVALGEWIVRQACSDLRAWSRLRPDRHLTVAVNVAPVQLATANFADVVSAILDDVGVAPSSLIIEITERTLLRDGEHHRQVMGDLRAVGIHFALDDFGTGYSALGYLTRFPIDLLKIDRSFIDAMSTDPRSTRLVEGILAMAGGLGMQTVAEGIETDVQLEVLTAMRCPLGQGYLLGRPVPAADIAAQLALACSRQPLRR